MPTTLEWWIEQCGDSFEASCPLCARVTLAAYFVTGRGMDVRSSFRRIVCDCCGLGFDSPARMEVTSNGDIRFNG